MLVVTLEVHGSGPRQLRTRFQNGDVRAAGVEPHIENVGFFAERRAAARAAKVGREEIADGMLEPGVSAFAAEEIDDARKKFRRRNRLRALLAVQNGERHAPKPLPRDAPVL